MAFDISGVSNIALGWFKSGVFWLILTAVLTLCAFILLYVNKKRKLKYNCGEIVSFGNGKIGLNMMTAGSFKKNTALFGMWDYGREFRYKTNDGRTIYDASENDLHDINGRKGFLVRRKDGDPKILVPVSRVEWRNENLLFEIAPSDFRDASNDIIDSSTKETQGWADKYLPYIMIGGIVIFFVITMILASQFFNRTVDKAGQILLQAGRDAGNVAGGTAP
jgi:hypothetical protein